jgi:outer membrane protein assembly complex protein YaeT
MTRGERRRTRFSRLSAILLAILTGSLGCHEDSVTVASLAFDGNVIFSDSELSDVIVTEASGWLPWSRKHPFDQDVFDADIERLRAFHADRGFPDASVTPAAIEFNGDNTEVSLRIAIDEGEPVLVESIEFEGLYAFTPAVVERMHAIPLQPGQPYDLLLLAESHEHVLGVLRDSGYPHPNVRIRPADGTPPDRVRLTVTVVPGIAATFGEVTFEGLRAISEEAAMRTLAFRPGELYRESQVLESQRRLTTLGIFTFAHVGERLEKGEEIPERAVVPMKVAVSEADPTRLQFGIGYGSEDGPRGSFEWRHLNFLRDARQLTTNARYSNRLRGLQADFLEPYFLSRALSIGGQLSAWWRDEPTYTARTYGGRITLTSRWRQSRGLLRTPVEHAARVAYVSESLRYAIAPDALEDVTNFDEFIALGFDPVTGGGSGRLASIDVGVDRVLLDDLIDPQTGHRLDLHLSHAAPWLGGTFSYDEVVAGGRIYVPLGRAVWASRGRAGVIIAGDPRDVPFSARYFLGGSSSLRGWGRFEVAPLTTDGLPIGGQAVLELSTELRLPLAGAFGAVAFVDAGNVWSTRRDVSVSDLRVDVGPGLRWRSPVGVVRADIGYQLTPIEGLVVSGMPERRRWRIHFSIGHAF